jgi:hypothetical protein
MVVVPHLRSFDAVANRKLHSFLHDARENVDKFDVEDETIVHATTDIFEMAGHDFRGSLPRIEGETSGDPLVVCKVTNGDDSVKGPRVICKSQGIQFDRSIIGKRGWKSDDLDRERLPNLLIIRGCVGERELFSFRHFSWASVATDC